jgi:hypothetical protein
MKGAPRVFGAFACGPVLDLNGETLTFILDRGWQVMGLRWFTVHRTIDSFIVCAHTIKRLSPRGIRCRA